MELILKVVFVDKKPNRLINEKSPYLLQHAYNPVDWHPWCDEAFEKAKRECSSAVNIRAAIGATSPHETNFFIYLVLIKPAFVCWLYNF